MSNDTDTDDSLHEREDSPDDTPSEEDIDDGRSLWHDETEKVNKKTIDDFGSDVEIDADVAENVDENDLLDGLQVGTTDEISAPDRLVDQVIGQEYARDAIMKAARQCYHVTMVSSPGMGKSMLVKAMSELLPREGLQNVLVYHNPDDGNRPKVRAVPAGRGDQIVEVYKEEARKRSQMRSFLMWIIIAVVLGYSLIIARQVLFGILVAGIIYLALRYGSCGSDTMIPNLIVDNADQKSAPFQDVTDAHAGMLFGDVRHSPFQSGGMETPGHNRVEPGAIRKSNEGVLLVNEVNTLDVCNQQYLTTAIQKDEFSITGQSERSSNVMVQTESALTDLIITAAGNLDAVKNMHPAFHSRIKGHGYEVYMDGAIRDAPKVRHRYARFVAQEVTDDGWLPRFTEEAVEELIPETRRRADRKGHLTPEFRNFGGLVRVADDIVCGKNAGLTTRDHVLQAKRRTHSIEQQIVDQHVRRRKDYELSVSGGFVINHVSGLVIMGEDFDIMLPVVAEVTPSQGPGQVIVTGQLEGVAEELVQNVLAIVKKFSGQDLSEVDMHAQFVQTGQQGANGDSAFITVATAVISALEDIPIDQSVAMAGSLPMRGDVPSVGGVTHRIEAVAEAGCSTVIIPATDKQDMMIEDEYKEMVDIVLVSHISEVLDITLEGEPEKGSLVDHLRSIIGSTLNKGQGVKDLSGPGP